MKTISVIAIALFITGCATPVHLTHPTKNSNDFERDKYACERQATEHVRNMGYMTQNFGPNPLMVREETIKCLRLDKGWN